MEVTLEITNYCEHECVYCPANAADEDTDETPIFYLAASYIKEVLDSISAKYNLDRINIVGGEPLAHNEFYDILKLCRSYTTNVWVYTNALNQIAYNTDAVGEIKVEANVYLLTGKSAYIPSCADKINLIPLDKSKIAFVDENSSGHLCLKSDGYVVKIG